MAKKKRSWKKKLGKALMAGAALAGGLALAKRGKGTTYRNVHDTGAVAMTPGRERWHPGVGGETFEPKSMVGYGHPIVQGNVIKQGMYKSGGRVRGAGKAKRGLGRAFSKGRK